MTATGPLPPAVRLLIANAQPATVAIEVSDNGTLEVVHGSLEALSLEEVISPGRKISDLSFLIGYDLSCPGELDCVDIGTGHAIDIRWHSEPGSQTFLVLISAEDERQGRQALQRVGNESRLMIHRQQRLVDQLIAARSELDLRRREAERALRAKSQFIAGLSHEFRTPLTSVIGYANWLTDSLEDSAAKRQALAISRSGRHMLSMVDNLLEEARLENEQTELHETSINVRSLAEDLSAIMAPLAADKGIAFAAFVDPDMPDAIRSDEMRLRQILINLLGNAVKFTDQGFVHLTLSRTDENLHMEVADSGPGIDEADRVRIFSAFERVKGDRGKSGAGLGLHITLRLVHLMGGSIGLDSEKGRGTRFHVRIPAPIPDVPETLNNEDAADNSSHGVRLVIAEDDPDIVQLMELYLGRAGYRLTVVSDGQQAVDKALEHEPGVVIMDLNMPILDGIGAVKQLREKGFSRPIIALTGATLDEDRIRAIEAGFDAFVPKPVRMPELLARLRELTK